MILDESMLKILDLEEPSIQELRHISKKLNIKLRRSMKKKHIIKEIQKELRKLEQEGLINPKNKQKEVPNLNFNLTIHYKDSLNCMSVNPTLMYIYWTLSEETINSLNTAKKIFFLRVLENDTSGKIIRILETPIDIFKIKKFYINVNPNSIYYSEIGYKEKLKFVPILRSNEINTPQNSPSYDKNEVWLNLKTNTIEIVESNKYGLIIEKINTIYSINNERNSISSSFVWNGYDNK